MSVDDFQRPVEVTGKDAICILLIRLLLLSPGTNLSHPKMGVGLITRYRYTDPEQLSDLKIDINNQIATYLPELQGVQIDLAMDPDNERELIIKATADGVLYSFETDFENGTLKLVSV